MSDLPDMSGQINAKEALVGELLAELDTVIKRVDLLPGEILAASRALTDSRVALETASNRFKSALHEYAEQSKLDFARQIKLQTEDLGSRMLSQQRAIMQAVALESFQVSTMTAAKNLAAAMEAATERLHRSEWSLLVGIGLGAAAVSSAVTLVAVYLLR